MIGVGLYGRTTQYDPKLDNIVRTQARRVRERLEKYYLDEGAADPLIIRIPKGSYVPVFVRHDVLSNQTRPDKHASTSGKAAEAKATPSWIVAGVGMAIVMSVASLLTQLPMRRPPAPPARGAVTNPRVVVLPFRGAVASSEDHLYGHAMADAIVAGLAGISDLSVTAPAESAEAHTSGAEYEPTIAVQMNADYLLTGHFERKKAKSTIFVKLTEVAGGGVIWSSKYSFKWVDLVKIEQEMSSAVTSRLSLALGERHAADGRHVPAASSDAHREFMIGHYAATASKRSASLESYSTAERHLKRALEVEPDYPDAHSTLAGLLLFRALPWTKESYPLLAQAESHLQQALKRAPRSSEALAALARSRILRHDLRGAHEYGRKAVEAEPGNVDALSALADVYSALGLYECALETYLQASRKTFVAMEPFVFGSMLAAQLGKRDVAERLIRDHAQVEPESLFRIAAEGGLFLRTGEPTGAEAKYRQVRGILMARQVSGSFNTGAHRFADVSIALSLAKQGKLSNAQEIVRGLGPPVPHRVSDEILLLLAVGHHRSALQAIEASFHHQNYRFLVTEPGLKPLYGEPEFRWLLEKTHTEWASLLKESGDSLPARPPALPTLAEFMRTNGFKQP